MTAEVDKAVTVARLAVRRTHGPCRKCLLKFWESFRRNGYALDGLVFVDGFMSVDVVVPRPNGAVRSNDMASPWPAPKVKRLSRSVRKFAYGNKARFGLPLPDNVKNLGRNPHRRLSAGSCSRLSGHFE